MTQRKFIPDAATALAMTSGFSGNWTVERIKEEWFENRNSDQNLRTANEHIRQLKKLGFDVVRIDVPNK